MSRVENPVWVVLRRDYDEAWVLGVGTTKEKAHDIALAAIRSEIAVLREDRSVKFEWNEVMSRYDELRRGDTYGPEWKHVKGSIEIEKVDVDRPDAA